MNLSILTVRSITSVNRSWRVLAVLYACMLLLAAVVAFGFESALVRAFRDSMMPEKLLEGFDSNVFNDLMRAHEGFFAPFLHQIVWLTIAWMLLNTLLGGGILAALQRGSSDSIAQFFSDCGTYLGRFFLLLIISAFLLFFFGGVWTVIVAFMFSALTAGSVTEVPNIIGAFTAGAVILIPIIIIMMIIDYARVRIVADDMKPVLGAVWQSTKFVFRNFFATFGWQLLILLLLIIFGLVYWLISDAFSMETGFGIFLTFLLQQISVASRIWGRLVGIGGQIQLYESRGKGDVAAVMVGFVPPAPTPLPPMPLAPIKKAGLRKKTTRRAAAAKGKLKKRTNKRG